MGYSKNALSIPELTQVFTVRPTDRLLLQTVSATNEVAVSDFVNSYSTVFYTFTLSSNGDLLYSLFTNSTLVSATDLGRVRPVFTGPYDPARLNVPNDIVYYNGSSFIALLSSTNVTPVSGVPQWGLLVQGFIPGATVTVVDSIVALRNIDTTQVVNGTVVVVAGYYNTDDRGGGDFRWVNSETTADDGGRFIRPNGVLVSNPGRWHRLLDGERANTKMWGAKGDGVTNDSTALQSALAAMSSTWTLELLVPAGIYKITSGLTLNPRVHVYGEGPSINNSVILVPQATNVNIFTTTGTSALSTTDYDDGLLIENLALVYDGYTNSGTTNTTNAAITISQPGNAHAIRNVAIYGGGYGIICNGSGSPGLRMQNIECVNTWVAPIKIGVNTYSLDFAQLDFDGVSFRTAFPAAGAKGIWLSNVLANVAVRNLQAEGGYSAGVIRWDVPTITTGSTVNQLHVDSATYKGDGLSPFVTLTVLSAAALSAGGQQVPAITLGNLTLSGCPTIISDTISNYSVLSQGASALQCGEARVPFTYEVRAANDLGPNRKVRFVKADQSLTFFNPSSAGWYRIASGAAKTLNGNFTVASNFESTNFDAIVNEQLNNSVIIVNRFTRQGNWNALPFVSKARVSYNADATCFLDVYVSSVPGLSSAQFIDKYIQVSMRSENPNTSLCVPSAIDTVLTFSTVSAFTEVEFASGLIQTGGDFNTPHVKVGHNHLWFAEDKSLRHYNTGVKVVFVNAPGDTTGTGASAQAYFNNGVLSYIHVTSRGSGYTKDPFAFISPLEMNNGSGATLSARTLGSQVASVDVLAGGSSYTVAPSQFSGRRILTDYETGSNNANGSQPLRVMRKVTAVKTVSLTTPAANSRLVTGTGFLNNLFIGDRYKGPDTNIYEIGNVIDDTHAVFVTPYPTQISSGTFTQCSWLIFPPLSGYKYSIMWVKGWTFDSPSWAQGGAWTRISLRLKGAANAFTIATCQKADIASDSGHDLNIEAGSSGGFQFLAPNLGFSPDSPSTGRNTGTGLYLDNGVGCSLDFADNNGNFALPLAGTQPLFIEVHGYKTPINSNY